VTFVWPSNIKHLQATDRLFQFLGKPDEKGMLMHPTNSLHQTDLHLHIESCLELTWMAGIQLLAHAELSLA
jgi:hypothetical protein